METIRILIDGEGYAPQTIPLDSIATWIGRGIHGHEYLRAEAQQRSVLAGYRLKTGEVCVDSWVPRIGIDY